MKHIRQVWFTDNQFTESAFVINLKKTESFFTILSFFAAHRKYQREDQKKKKKSPSPVSCKVKVDLFTSNHPPSTKFVSYMFSSAPLTSIRSLPQEKEKCTHPSGPQNHKTLVDRKKLQYKPAVRADREQNHTKSVDKWWKAALSAHWSKTTTSLYLNTCKQHACITNTNTQFLEVTFFWFPIILTLLLACSFYHRRELFDKLWLTAAWFYVWEIIYIHDHIYCFYIQFIQK